MGAVRRSTTCGVRSALRDPSLRPHVGTGEQKRTLRPRARADADRRVGVNAGEGLGAEASVVLGREEPVFGATATHASVPAASTRFRHPAKFFVAATGGVPEADAKREEGKDGRDDSKNGGDAHDVVPYLSPCVGCV